MHPIINLFQRYVPNKNIKNKNGKITRRIFFKYSAYINPPGVICFYCSSNESQFCWYHQVMLSDDELYEIKNTQYPDGYILFW
jgi:hypothetical protein